MSKRFFASALACMLICTLAPMLTCCDVQEMSSLKDVSRPYAAEYKCKRLQIGGEDALEGYEFIKLDLKQSGNFVCRYLDKTGGEGSYTGKYRISGNQAIFSSEQNGEKREFSFPYEGGSIFVRYQFGERLLFCEFSAVE